MRLYTVRYSYGAAREQSGRRADTPVSGGEISLI